MNQYLTNFIRILESACQEERLDLLNWVDQCRGRLVRQARIPGTRAANLCELLLVVSFCHSVMTPIRLAEDFYQNLKGFSRDFSEISWTPPCFGNAIIPL